MLIVLVEGPRLRNVGDSEKIACRGCSLKVGGPPFLGKAEAMILGWLFVHRFGLRPGHVEGGALWLKNSSV